MIDAISFDSDKLRGREPRSLEGLDYLKTTHRIQTVLALNHASPNEGVEWARKLGIGFWNIEMCPVFPPTPSGIRLALSILTPEKKDLGIIYVHCRAGVDRTGMVVSAYKMRFLNWDYERAKVEMVQLGMHWWLRWWATRLRSY